MKNKREKRLRDDISQNLQSSSRAIEKRLVQRNTPRIPVAPTYEYAPAYLNNQHGTLQGNSIPDPDQYPGYIFLCNGKTKADCFKYRVFGLPSARMDILEKIKPPMSLFLFDFDLKLLYGVYIAASDGKLAIEPNAFGGQFSAQVRFEIIRDCIPLPESTFKPAIADNYKGRSKFRQELSNIQVANLISLFRPIAEPSPGNVGSLMPNTARSATILRQTSDFRAQTAPELSYRYNQFLDRSIPTDDRVVSTIRHVQPGLSAPHALITDKDLAPPYLHVQQSQSHPGLSNSAEHQSYSQENPVLHHRYTAMPHDTERLTLQHLEPRNDYHKQGKTAAYWVKMASEDPQGVYSSSQASIGVGSESLGASNVVVAQDCLAVAPTVLAVTNTDAPTVVTNTDAPTVITNADALTESVNQLHSEEQSHGPPYLQSSSSEAVYHVAQASQDHAHMHAGPRFGANMATSLLYTDPAAAHEIRHTGNILQGGHAYNYNPEMSASSSNVPVPAQGQLLPQVAVQAQNQLLPQVPVQAHSQLLPQVAVDAHGQLLPQAAQLLSSSATYWTGVSHQDPSQVYQYYAHLPSSESSGVYWTAAAHDPNQVYQYPHPQSAENNALYRTGGASQDPSQVYQNPYLQTYGQIGSYNHNVTINDPSLQVQAYDPSYVAGASQVPSSYAQ